MMASSNADVSNSLTFENKGFVDDDAHDIKKNGITDDDKYDFTKDIEDINLDDEVSDVKRERHVKSPINMKVVLVIVGVVLLCGIIIAGGIGGYFSSKGGGSADDVTLDCVEYTEPCDKYGVWCIADKSVLCTPDSDGWLTWLRHVDNSLNFNKTWDEYVQGFGRPDSNYWLGLELLYLLTGRNAKFKLEVHLTSWSDQVEVISYDNFSVYNSTTDYQLLASKFSRVNSTGENALEFVKTSGFSTWDRDNDDKSDGNCAASSGGGFWYRDCGYTSPTATIAQGKQGTQYVSWSGAFGESYESLKHITMRIKPSL